MKEYLEIDTYRLNFETKKDQYYIEIVLASSIFQKGLELLQSTIVYAAYNHNGSIVTYSIFVNDNNRIEIRYRINLIEKIED